MRGKSSTPGVASHRVPFRCGQPRSTFHILHAPPVYTYSLLYRQTTDLEKLVCIFVLHLHRAPCAGWAPTTCRVAFSPRRCACEHTCSCHYSVLVYSRKNKISSPLSLLSPRILSSGRPLPTKQRHRRRQQRGGREGRTHDSGGNTSLRLGFGGSGSGSDQA